MPSVALEELRAKRFPLHLQVKYRKVGEKRWFTGTTDNVSCSGMLVRGRRPLSPDSKVQLLLTMPSELVGAAQVIALCNGEVVRTAERNAPIVHSALGISISSCELFRQPVSTPPQGAAPLRARSNVPRIVQGLYELLVLIAGSSEVILADSEVGVNAKQHAAFIRSFALRASTFLDQLPTSLRPDGTSP